MLGKRVAADIIEIGQRLIAVKDALPHGAWLPWLDAEFGWGEDSARNYMRVHEAFKSRTVRDFEGIAVDARALYAISGPSVAPALREAVIEAAHESGKITIEEANRVAAEMLRYQAVSRCPSNSSTCFRTRWTS